MDDTTGSWRLSLRCTQAEAEAVAASDPKECLPVLLARELDPAKPAEWAIEAYLTNEPDAETIRQFQGLLPGGGDQAPVTEWIAPADWLTVSQAGLEPVRAGRFFVHTATHAGEIPEDAVAFRIEASRAFGTGHHETTTGCLLTLDRLKRDGARFANVADIGTGTGLLAFAALKLWPRANVVASDIDPIAIEVSHINAEANAIPVGTTPGSVELVTAGGMAHRQLRRRAPFDLIIANILAGPLIDLSPVLGNALTPGGTLILAGLLDHQAEAVANAYRRQGMRLAGRLSQGDWSILRLVKRRRPPISRGG